MTLVNKLFRAMDIIAKVIMVFIAAGFLFSLVGTVVLASFSDKTIEITGDVLTKLSITSDNEQISEALKKPETYMTGGFTGAMKPTEDGAELTGTTQWTMDFHDLRLFLINGMIALVCSFVAFFFFSKLAKHLSKSETPFTPETVKHLKILGIVIIAAFVVAGVMSDVLLSDISLLKSNSSNVVGFEFNLNYVIYVLAYIALIGVFKYGVKLEQEKKSLEAAGAGTEETHVLPESTDDIEK